MQRNKSKHPHIHPTCKRGNTISNLAVFSFNSNDVRVVLINGEPWFVANDICRILELDNVSDTLSRLKPYEKDDIDLIDTTGRTQKMRIISESGLYRLVLGSRKPQAEPFQDWVVQEVLPSIRKHGKYDAIEHKQPKRQLPPVRDIVDLTNTSEKILAMSNRLPVALTQLLLDGIGDAMCTLLGQKQLPPTQPRLIGVAQKAEEMGLPVTLKNRGNLGKFVKVQNLPVYQQEERLCNGQSRKINVYEDNEDLESAIRSYFA